MGQETGEYVKPLIEGKATKIDKRSDAFEDAETSRERAPMIELKDRGGLIGPSRGWPQLK